MVCLMLWSVVFQVADDAGLDVVRHGEQCSGKSKSATAAAAHRAVRSAPKAKYVNSNAFHLDTATFSLVKSILKSSLVLFKSLWTPVWEGSPGPAQSPALTQTPPRAPVSLCFLFFIPTLPPLF